MFDFDTYCAQGEMAILRCIIQSFTAGVSDTMDETTSSNLFLVYLVGLHPLGHLTLLEKAVFLASFFPC